jgi:hypothetical protein
VAIRPDEVEAWEDYVAAGADHLIIMSGPPFDLDPLARLIDLVRAPSAETTPGVTRG